MDYPINDIFEGLADLLEKHGEFVDHVPTPVYCDDVIRIIYGGYMYAIVKSRGKVMVIDRVEDTNNG